MTTIMKNLSVNMGNKQVQIQHNGISQITIMDEPLGEPYDHKKRHVINDNVHLLQNIPMMDFQAKIAMLFRGPLNIQGIPLPLSGVYEVEIELETCRGLDELPLLSVMKSVVDGLNIGIVANDQSIITSTIECKHLSGKLSPTKPPELLSVALFERIGNKRRLVQAIDHVPIYVVPKQEPLFLDYENDVLWSFDVDDLRDSIADALLADGLSIASGGPIKLTMNFEGRVKDKDLDNMAKAYFKLLEKIGLQAQDVHHIHLTKEQATKDSIRISLN
jgi:Holliday junction resolvase RusA-like endonuclease